MRHVPIKWTQYESWFNIRITVRKLLNIKWKGSPNKLITYFEKYRAVGED